jgi:DNA-binding CsgD family transcriptional regulator
MFGVFRHERNGLIDDETRRRMRLIVPHIRRAFLMTREMETRAFQAETLAVAFDGLTAGMIVVAANADVLYANRAGQAILRTGEMLRILGGRLAAADPEADQILREAFARIAETADPPLGRTGAVVPLIARGGERYLAHVLPLTLGAQSRASVCADAAAALFVHKAALDTAASHALAKAYRLTPTELRVLRAIAEIGGLPDVAVAFGVSESTVRTHVRRLFEKLGVNRQADLVKVVAGFSNPLVVD